MDKYTEKKKRNQAMLEIYKKHATPRMYELIVNCSSSISFITDREKFKKRWFLANTCKWRFCSMCSMREAAKNAVKISAMLEYLEKECDLRFIIVNPTVLNVGDDEMPDMVNKINLAVKNMFQREELMAMNHGYICKVELTYNKEEFITKDMWHGRGNYEGRSYKKHFTGRGLNIGDPNPNYDTYHPHLHFVVAVDKSYFKSRNYIKREKLLEIWRECMGDPRIENLYVERLKKVISKNEEGGEYEGYNVWDFAKYMAKDLDYTHSERVFDTFYKSLKGRQVLRYAGLFAEAGKKFKNGELEEYIQKDLTEYYWLQMYDWVDNVYLANEPLRLSKLDEKFQSELLKRGIVIAKD